MIFLLQSTDSKNETTYLVIRNYVYEMTLYMYEGFSFLTPDGTLKEDKNKEQSQCITKSYVQA